MAEYLQLAELAVGIDTNTLIRTSRLELADSALHAPGATFSDQEFYPDLYDKAAVLACRLALNHPLFDGNKRAAWMALAMFVELNDGHFDPDPPNVDEAEAAVIAIAAHEVEEKWFAQWLRARVRFTAVSGRVVRNIYEFLEGHENLAHRSNAPTLHGI
ncbi:type II toxin-antitoxin system death-on-curing family toxin [Ferrimicrobium sp.]|uniref:type II toxin-antitoxin system death-on-curing family toxin n=1 Tax=Ferrimicrobium sp. TaxID=2926050 RepID=UPI00344F07E6